MTIWKSVLQAGTILSSCSGALADPELMHRVELRMMAATRPRMECGDNWRAETKLS
jgi:hypothetical protein